MGIDYELVRIHHPDCSRARTLPPSTSHSRFQAISDAYIILSGKKPSSETWDRDVAYSDELRRRTRAQWRANAGSDEFGSTSTSAWENEHRERWDQGILIFIVVFVSLSSVKTSLRVIYDDEFVRHCRLPLYPYLCYPLLQQTSPTEGIMMLSETWRMHGEKRRSSLKLEEWA